MTIKGELTISRPQCSDGSQYISIKVKDIDAGIEFLNIKIPYAEFTQCLTGLAYQDCEFDIRGVENIGKKLETDTISFEVFRSYYKRDDEELIYLAEEATPPGWICSKYFGSQSSFFMSEGKKFARTSIRRWVEKSKEEEK